MFVRFDVSARCALSMPVPPPHHVMFYVIGYPSTHLCIYKHKVVNMLQLILAVASRMASSGGDGHRHARSQTMPIIRGKNALTNPKLLQMMETGNTLFKHPNYLEYKADNVDLSQFILVPFFKFFLDGTILEADSLSPTDIEANLSTEVALTVLDVLELFVHHHKVSRILTHHSHHLN